MNLREFAVKNVSRNIKAYLAYFGSSTISATLLFAFTMIVFHPNFKEVELPEYLTKALNLTIVIAYSFLCFFVFYSVSVFLKRRYKEFGILYIIGGSKSQIQKMICIENMIISFISGVLGIFIGVIFSKLLLALSGKLLGFDAMDLYFPVEAVVITLIAFVTIGIVISIFCSFIIKEDMVFKLLKGTKKPRNEPKTSKLLAGLCVVMLVVGYYFAVTSNMLTISYRIIPITVIVVIATYLLFSQLTTTVIKILKKNTKFYMNKTTMLWVSNLYYRVKDNTRMFFLITITMAMALTAIGGVYAYWSDKEAQINKSFPQTFFIYDSYDKKAEINKRFQFIDDEMKSSNFEFKKTTGDMKFATTSDGGDEVAIISEDNYRNLLNLKGFKVEHLTFSEAIVCENNVNENREELNFGKVKLKTKDKVCGNMLPAIFEEVYVVSNEAYDEIEGNRRYFAAFDTDDFKSTTDICKNYNSNYSIVDRDKYTNNFLKATILENTKAAYGVLLFSVIFIGLIFFVTTASFLYNKCYMDVIEDKSKYKQLNKLGLTFKEIKKIITVEVGVLFLLPYIVAVIHFCFAINALKYSFDIPIASVALQIIGAMFFIQVIYFLVIKKNYLVEIKRELI